MGRLKNPKLNEKTQRDLDSMIQLLGRLGMEKLVYAELHRLQTTPIDWWTFHRWVVVDAWPLWVHGFMAEAVENCKEQIYDSAKKIVEKK